jgi:lipopolysaccharide biosynthesis protein
MEKINKIISNSANCGVIAAENYISKELKKENHFVGTNGKILEELMKQYELKCRNFEFIAGTMFWAKANILLDFFKRHDPFKIRQTLEFGNVLDNFSGSHTHSWERILTWIITSKGLTIKTVK